MEKYSNPEPSHPGLSSEDRMQKAREILGLQELPKNSRQPNFDELRESESRIKKSEENLMKGKKQDNATSLKAERKFKEIQQHLGFSENPDQPLGKANSGVIENVYPFPGTVKETRESDQLVEKYDEVAELNRKKQILESHIAKFLYDEDEVTWIQKQWQQNPPLVNETVSKWLRQKQDEWPRSQAGPKDESGIDSMIEPISKRVRTTLSRPGLIDRSPQGLDESLEDPFLTSSTRRFASSKLRRNKSQPVTQDLPEINPVSSLESSPLDQPIPAVKPLVENIKPKTTNKKPHQARPDQSKSRQSGGPDPDEIVEIESYYGSKSPGPRAYDLYEQRYTPTQESPVVDQKIGEQFVESEIPAPQPEPEMAPEIVEAANAQPESKPQEKFNQDYEPEVKIELAKDSPPTQSRAYMSPEAAKAVEKEADFISRRNGERLDFSEADSMVDLQRMVIGEKYITDGTGRNSDSDTVMAVIYDRLLNAKERDWTQITLRHRLRETVYRMYDQYARTQEFAELRGFDLDTITSEEGLKKALAKKDILHDRSGKLVKGIDMATKYIGTQYEYLLPDPILYKLRSLRTGYVSVADQVIVTIPESRGVKLPTWKDKISDTVSRVTNFFKGGR